MQAASKRLFLFCEPASEVADQLAAAAGEDRRKAGKTCPLLLALAGGGVSDAAAFWGDARPDSEPGWRVHMGIRAHERLGEGSVARTESKMGRSGSCRWE